ncbi:MAG: methyltransferase domain-containing protein, partial [Emcibacteraceae bacterium]|nr:methyltransferase domain-containing protein [Emcibacteraceae bacterium]
MTRKKPQFKAPMKESDIFNRSLLKIRREHIAENFGKYDFLNLEISDRLIDNLRDIKRTFPTVLNMNTSKQNVTDHFKKSFIIHQDLAFNMLHSKFTASVQADEEFLSFKNQSLDLILSCLNLHWVNDLPGALVQILRSLKPDGLFLGAILGGETLTELRRSMLKAEMDHLGGIRPHISPFTDVRDAGALMQRAG